MLHLSCNADCLDGFGFQNPSALVIDFLCQTTNKNIGNKTETRYSGFIENPKKTTELDYKSTFPLCFFFFS